MIEIFQQLFATDFMPHGYCIRRPEIIWLHEISDGDIWVESEPGQGSNFFFTLPA